MRSKIHCNAMVCLENEGREYWLEGFHSYVPGEGCKSPYHAVDNTLAHVRFLQGWGFANIQYYDKYNEGYRGG